VAAHVTRAAGRRASIEGSQRSLFSTGAPESPCATPCRFSPAIPCPVPIDQVAAVGAQLQIGMQGELLELLRARRKTRSKSSLLRMLARLKVSCGAPPLSTEPSSKRSKPPSTGSGVPTASAIVGRGHHPCDQQPLGDSARKLQRLIIGVRVNACRVSHT